MADKRAISYLIVPVRAGVVEGICSVNTNLTVTVMDFIDGVTNTPPTFSGETPTGAGIAADAPIQFSCSDDVGCNLATLTVDFEDHLGVTHRVYENSDFVSPYTGTCTANGSNGYDFALSHDPLHIGDYSITANVSDGDGEPATPLVYSWTVTAVAPTITGTYPSLIVDPDVEVHFHATAGDWELPSSGITLMINGVVVLAADSWTADYSGTVTADGDNWLVTCTSHPPWPVGALSAQADLEDEVGATATDTWGATVEDDPPTITLQHPEGVTTTLERIGCRLAHPRGLNLSTLRLVARGPFGQRLTAISAGLVDSDWQGLVLPSGDNGYGDPLVADIELTGWPELTNPGLWTFELDASSSTGAAL